MSMFFKKYYYKFFNKKKYLNIKSLKKLEDSKRIFKEKYEDYIYFLDIHLIIILSFWALMYYLFFLEIEIKF